MNQRPLYIALSLGAAAAVLTTFVMPDRVVLNSAIQSFADMVASVVPCVDVAAKRAREPARTELTWAVQSVFGAAYFVLLLIVQTPWSRRARIEFINQYKPPRRKPNRFVCVIGFLAIGWLIFADFGVTPGMSFYRGDAVIARPGNFPGLYGNPGETNFIMAFSAWFIPLGIAYYYFIFLLLIFNAKFLLARKFRAA